MPTAKYEDRGRLFHALSLLLTVAISATGCMHSAPVSPKEHPPVFQDASANPREKLSEGAAISSQVPLSLDRAVEEALRASPELEQIRGRIDAAQEQVRQAEAVFYPRVSLSEEFNVTNNAVYALMYIINQRRLEANVDFNNPGRQQNVASRVQAEWYFFEGGSRWYERKAAVGQRRSVDAELQAARNRLAAKVAETYYQWLKALSFIGVAERAFEAAKTDEQLGAARMRVEMALSSEIARLKAHSAEMHGNLVAALASARRLQAGLERLLARHLNPEEIPDPALFTASWIQDEPPPDADPLVRQAIEKRPEIIAVKALVDAAFERVRSARGGLLPRLGTMAQYQWDSEDLDSTARSWLFGVQASWPIFEGGVTLSRIREARARLHEIKARGDQVALDIALEVRQAVLTLQETAEKIKVQDERRKWAQKALDEVRHLYRNEVVGVDTLLQAEVACNQAEVSYTAALFEERIARALLRQSLGDFADGI